MKKTVTTLLMIVMLLSFASLASAHVTVQPAEAPANSYQVFTVRVPSEKEIATTIVKVAIPDGVSISRFEPMSDWTYVVEKNSDNKITSVTWTTKGEGLGATEFGQFRMQGKIAEDATELVWKAYQTYANGEVVEWTGASDADKPASVTTVTAAVGDGHGHGTSQSTTTSSESNDNNRDPLTLSIAIAGLVLSMLALAVVLLRKRA
ncbi:MAG: YcnI family protein [Candidatus Cohnella colombiensis]|uniref:YcnI family protein n=1 Tax=Candidatus Cohnella colombiensis TaxID=3121368 RepID=A0AA95F034_9BACL|nr:MAG: YcnI family protein [Cohnella sp.]